MHRAAAAVGLVALSLVVASCFKPPKPGDPCADAEVVCFDPQTALECLGGVRVGVHCGGPNGCRSGATGVWCDQSDAAENDLCFSSRMRHFGDAACALDKKTMLGCPKGRFVKRADCRGPLGCSHVGQQVTCDNSISEVGDACDGEGATCSTDHAAKLRCQSGRMVLAAKCEGDDHCKIAGTAVHCDERRGTVGAACTASAACAADGKAMLECQSGAWALVAPCRGPEGCTVTDTSIACDTSLAVVGEGCEGKGASCAADGKTMLQCTGGKWSVERVCQKACEVRKSEHVVACK